MYNLKNLIKSFSISVAILLALNIILYLIGTGKYLDIVKYKSFVILGLYLLQSLILILPLYFLVFKKYKVNSKDLGFRKVKLNSLMFSIIMGYLFFLGISTLVTIISLRFDLKIPGFEAQEPHLPLFGEDNFSLIIAFILIVILGPLVEEIIFRGYLLQVLAKRFNVLTGSILSALIFATIHVEFQSILPLFLLGLILNWLFLRLNSIWPPLIFHAMNNALALLAEYYLV